MSTITLRNTKGSALTFTEMDNNFTNLNSDKLEAVVSDTTPQLGGDLDVNGNSIVSASNGNIAITPNGTGKVILDGLSWPTSDGSANYVLKTDGAGNLSWTNVAADTNTTYSVSAETATGGVNLRLTGSDASTDDVKLANGSNITITRTDANTITIAATDTDTGILNVVEDTTPQLGGNLDVNGNEIVSTSNGDIRFTPNGTGNIDLNVVDGNIYLDYATWPASDGTSGYVLTTNGAGTLSWSAAAGGGASELNDLSDVSYSGAGISAGDILVWDGLNSYFTNGSISISSDTTPELGGNLNAGGYTISNPVLEDYAETVYSLGSTDSPTITIGNGNVQSVTITSGLSLPAFSDAATGQSVTLIVTGSGTASGTAAYKFAGGNTTLTSYSVVSVFYDGTTYWASIATDFQ